MIARDRDSDSNGSLEERIYVAQDANFNVTALIDTSGTVQERFQYDAFGSFTVLTGTWGSRASSSYAWKYLHQGGRWDADANVFSFRNRDYSPILGRWLQLDPLRFSSGDVNFYRGYSNCAIRFTDPSGLQTIGLLKPYTVTPTLQDKIAAIVATYLAYLYDPSLNVIDWFGFYELHAATVLQYFNGLLMSYHRVSTSPISPEKLKELIKQLGDKRYQVREKASLEIANLLGRPFGCDIAVLIEFGLRNGDTEISSRVEELLNKYLISFNIDLLNILIRSNHEIKIFASDDDIRMVLSLIFHLRNSAMVSPATKKKLEEWLNIPAVKQRLEEMRQRVEGSVLPPPRIVDR